MVPQVNRPSETRCLLRPVEANAPAPWRSLCPFPGDLVLILRCRPQRVLSMSALAIVSRARPARRWSSGQQCAMHALDSRRPRPLLPTSDRSPLCIWPAPAAHLGAPGRQAGRVLADRDRQPPSALACDRIVTFVVVIARSYPAIRLSRPTDRGDRSRAIGCHLPRVRLAVYKTSARFPRDRRDRDRATR